MVSFMQRGPGISHETLVFLRDVKMFSSWMDILAIGAISENTLANFLKNLIFIIFDCFHDDESSSCDFFFIVMDGKIVNH